MGLRAIALSQAAIAMSCSPRAVCTRPSATWAKGSLSSSITAVFPASKAIALNLLGRHEEALDWARQSLRQPRTAVWANMAEVSALGHLGRDDEAREALARARAIKPDLSIGFVDVALKFKVAADRAHYVDGLRRAGLDE